MGGLSIVRLTAIDPPDELKYHLLFFLPCCKGNQPLSLALPYGKEGLERELQRTPAAKVYVLAVHMTAELVRGICRIPVFDRNDSGLVLRHNCVYHYDYILNFDSFVVVHFKRVCHDDHPPLDTLSDIFSSKFGAMTDPLDRLA